MTRNNEDTLKFFELIMKLIEKGKIQYDTPKGRDTEHCHRCGTILYPGDYYLLFGREQICENCIEDM